MMLEFFIAIIQVPFGIGLECYFCLSRTNLNFFPGKEPLTHECKGDMKDWPRMICDGDDVCTVVTYTIGDSQYDIRTCLDRKFCGFGCKTKITPGTPTPERNNFEGLQNLTHAYCASCDTDNCNAGGKISWDYLSGLLLMILPRIPR